MTTNEIRAHLAQLAVERRHRMARRGKFGPVVAALYRIADLIEYKQRTGRHYRRTRTRAQVRPVWVYTDMILHRAVYGPLMYWQPKRPIGHQPYDFRDAPAEVWTTARALRDEVSDLLHTRLPRKPGPLDVHPEQVRALAEELAAKVMPLPGDDAA